MHEVGGTATKEMAENTNARSGYKGETLIANL